MSTPSLTVAVVGATGAVGETMLAILAERAFPATQVIALASERSAGDQVDYGLNFTDRPQLLRVGIGQAVQHGVAALGHAGGLDVVERERRQLRHAALRRSLHRGPGPEVVQGRSCRGLRQRRASRKENQAKNGCSA